MSQSAEHPKRRDFIVKVLDILGEHNLSGKMSDQVLTVMDIVNLLEATHDQAWDNGVGDGQAQAIEGFITSLKNSRIPGEYLKPYLREQFGIQ